MYCLNLKVPVCEHVTPNDLILKEGGCYSTRRTQAVHAGDTAECLSGKAMDPVPFIIWDTNAGIRKTVAQHMALRYL